MTDALNYTIVVNDTATLVGRCVGQYIDKVRCNGNYTASLYALNDGNRLFLEDFGRCEGITDKNGCSGKYSRDLLIGNQTVNLVSSQDANFDFKNINGVTVLNGLTGNSTSTNFTGLCNKKFDV